jgi:hypothetical protein
MCDDSNVLHVSDEAFEEMPQSEEGRHPEPAEEISGKISTEKTCTLHLLIAPVVNPPLPPSFKASESIAPVATTNREAPLSVEPQSGSLETKGTKKMISGSGPCVVTWSFTLLTTV